MRRKKKLSSWKLYALTVIGFLLTLVIVLSFRAILAGVWDGKSRFTVIVNSDPLLLFSVEPNTSEAALLIIPANTILDVPYSYNTYPATSVFALGNLDLQKGGGKLLSKSIENTFGVMVDGFVAWKEDLKPSASKETEELLKLKKNYFSVYGLPSLFLKFLNVDKKMVKNISFIDLMRLWTAMRNTRNDRITILNLENNNVLSKEKLPDGSLVRILNKELFDQSIAINFQDRQVRLQNLSIEVVNASGKEKIAGQFSRVLQNLGANVVVKSTSPTDENFNCRVYVTSKIPLSDIIFHKLEKYFKCTLIKTEDRGVSDVKVVLGKEFVK